MIKKKISRSLSLGVSQLHHHVIKIEIGENSSFYKIKLLNKEFMFDMKDSVTNDLLQSNQHFLSIFLNAKLVEDQFYEKQQKKFPEITKITNHHNVTALETYFEYLQALIRFRQKDPQNASVKEPPEDYIDKCCICLFEFYEDIINYDFAKILKQMESNQEEDVIRLNKCEAHGFHKSCFCQFIKDQDFVKCPICSNIYGIMKGDQPEGSMRYYVDKHTHCDGYKKDPTICLSFSFRSGIRNGINYHGTHRDVYLPYNKDGIEILKLLKIAFDRRLIFTIGTSVTTGRSNTVIWNGIHFKTNLYGGSANFGYPDPTYFNRIKLELADKGIYPDLLETENVDLKEIQEKGYGDFDEDIVEDENECEDNEDKNEDEDQNNENEDEDQSNENEDDNEKNENEDDNEKNDEEEDKQEDDEDKDEDNQEENNQKEETRNDDNENGEVYNDNKSIIDEEEEEEVEQNQSIKKIIQLQLDNSQLEQDQNEEYI